MFMDSQQICRTRLSASGRGRPEAVPGRKPPILLAPPQMAPRCAGSMSETQPRCPVPPAALRAPRHAYGGPEPFGTGAGVLRWEREAGSLLYDHLRVEREKDWKRLRHKLILNGMGPQEVQQLGQDRAQEIQEMRMKVRYKKFWDLMNERDRPWHFDVVVHLCTELSPYTCERYNSVTAGTMQGILAQRAKAERAVRDLREDCRTLRRRLIAMTLRMARSGRPVSDEQLSQMERLHQQLSAGSGVAEWQLRRLQAIARATYQDYDYADHVSALLPLLQETKRVGDLARREMLPAVRKLQSELEAFQDDLAERRLSRDQVLDFLEELRNRYLPSADGERWPGLRQDEEVGWRYPPMSYWRTYPRDGVRRAAAAVAGGSSGDDDDDDGGGGGAGGGSGSGALGGRDGYRGGREGTHGGGNGAGDLDWAAEVTSEGWQWVD